MRLVFSSLDDWLARADHRFDCALPRFSVRDGAGNEIAIKPFVVLCRNVSIIGGDWVPFYDDGSALIDQMVHVPGHYPAKAYNIVQDDEGCALTVPVEPIDEDVVLIGGRSNYYHWMIDFLPRLLMARDAVGSRRLVVNEDLTAFQLETLASLGYGPDRLLRVDEHRAIRPRSAVIPSLLVCVTAPHKALPALLREAFPPTRPGTYERIFVSRADVPRRMLTNEAELVSLLERYGFVSVMPGRMSVEEQRNLFYGAKAVVAVHGAGLSNMVFCERGCNVLEIAPPEYRPTFFSMLAAFCGHPHEFAAARVVVPATDGRPINSTWAADLDSVEAALRKRFAAR